jgi:predicted ribosome quality control (RQC) complex YloA/Tae2 family protein
MHFELIVNVVEELSTHIAGAKISKVYQPAENLIIIKYWDGRTTHRLLLCADSKKSRIHLTDEEYLNPSTPPRFCQLLRSRLTKLLSIEVLNDDRIVQIVGTGKHGHCSLIVELTGKTSNMVLIDADGVVIDCLKRSSTDGEGRGNQPGAMFVLPEKLNLDTEAVSRAQLVRKESQSWNQCVEKYYKDGFVVSDNQDLKKQLVLTVNNQMKKLNKRLKNIEIELDKQQNSEQVKQQGELVLANLHQIKRGMVSIHLENYYLNPPEAVTVTLDPLLSPQKNAEKYFQKYKKFKKGLEHSQRRLDETKTELEWIQQLEFQLSDNVKTSDIEEIAQELREAKLLKEKNRLHHRRTQQESKPFESLSPKGFKVFWGRNNRQNDFISTKVLKSGDLWFHVYHAPGTHVVLKSSGSNMLFTDEDKVYAASIAAGYSKLKNDTKVEVMQATAESVKKPKNSRPGLVSVQKHSTLLVKPLRIEN